MSMSIRHAIACGGSLLCCAAAQAQSGSTTATTPAATAATTRLDPLDAKAAVAPLIYESSFARYRRLGDEKPLAWREANDAVARIGGWRVYAREAQQAEPAPPTASAASAPAASATTPKPSMHDGHKMP